VSEESSPQISQAIPLCNFPQVLSLAKQVKNLNYLFILFYTDHGQAWKGSILKRELLIEKILPAFIFLSLWLDGWFFPLLLLPFLYVTLVERKNLSWLGFGRKEIARSIFLGTFATVFLIAVCYPIFLYYAGTREYKSPTLTDQFTDIIWYPLYEEVAYRSFLLVHFTDFKALSSQRNLLVNLLQSLLFLSIHRHHIISGMPLLLIPVFLLGFLNGFIFQRTRNIFGCIFSHMALNGFALFFRFS